MGESRSWSAAQAAARPLPAEAGHEQLRPAHRPDAEPRVYSTPPIARAPARIAPPASTTLPTALRTTNAPTTTSPAASAHVPTPPFMAPRGPSALPTVAPVPAPTDPSAIALEAAAQAR